MRIGPFHPRHHPVFGLLAGLAFAACSGSGGGPTGPSPIASQDRGATFTLQGQVLDQLSGFALSGVRVTAGGASTLTGPDGRFTLAAVEGHEMVLSVAGYFDRVTTVGPAAGLAIVPREFDMSAFNDVARDNAAGTVRWQHAPDVYVDVRPHGFGSSSPVPQSWIDEVSSLAPRFLADWSGGRLSARSVTVGSSPPAPGTPGSVVIAFDEDASRYPSASAAGVAIASWDGDGALRSATIRLRFSGLTGDAAALSRQAVLGHEIGHAMGFSHMEGSTFSMMAAVVRTPQLTVFDRAAGGLLYDRRPGTRADDREVTAGARASMGPATSVAAATCAVEVATGS